MSTKIHIPKAVIENFCRRNHIRRLALFGSVLRDDFGSESDVEVLVEFEEGARGGLIRLAGIELELGKLLGHEVQIHTVKGLHPQFRDEVLRLAEVQIDFDLLWDTVTDDLPPLISALQAIANEKK